MPLAMLVYEPHARVTDNETQMLGEKLREAIE
jgi:hypothetical protein